MNDKKLKGKLQELAKGYSIDRGYADRLNFPEKAELEENEVRTHLKQVIKAGDILASIQLWGWSLDMYTDLNNIDGISLDSYYVIAFIDGPGERQFYGIYDSFIEAWHGMENEYYKDAKDNNA